MNENSFLKTGFCILRSEKSIWMMMRGDLKNINFEYNKFLHKNKASYKKILFIIFKVKLYILDFVIIFFIKVSKIKNNLKI